MRTRYVLVSFLLIATVALLTPNSAAAGPEVTFVLGAMIGDSLSDVLQVRPDNLTEGFKTAPIFGGIIRQPGKSPPG